MKKKKFYYLINAITSLVWTIIAILLLAIYDANGNLSIAKTIIFTLLAIIYSIYYLFDIHKFLHLMENENEKIQ